MSVNDGLRKMKPTVIIATGVMNAGGAETLIMELLRRSTGRVRYVLLVHHSGVPTKGLHDDEIEKLGIQIVNIQSVGSLGERKYIQKFRKIIFEVGHVDIIHSHLNAVGGVIAKAAKAAGINCRIVHCHADIAFSGSFLNKLTGELKLALLKTKVTKYATAKWACSHEAALRLFNCIDDVTIIPNVIYLKDFMETKKKREETRIRYGLSRKLVLGSVGRIARIKNYELVVLVVSNLAKAGYDVEFICFGRVVDKDYYSELLSLGESLNVIDRLHFVGNSDNIVDDLSCIDVLLMPSHSEGFGMAALESQAAGIPTIVSCGVPRSIDMGLGLVTFLSIENQSIWAESIKEQHEMNISPDKILEQFNIHGLNSETAVLEIEDKYLELVEGSGK